MCTKVPCAAANTHGTSHQMRLWRINATPEPPHQCCALATRGWCDCTLMYVRGRYVNETGGR